MAGFSHEDAHRFWSSYDDPNVYKTIMFMDASEPWTLDGNEELENILFEITTTLQTATEIKSMQKLIKLFSSIKISRVLFIMQSLDNANPGTASRLLAFAEEHRRTDKWCDLMVKRNLTFERLRIISRVFSESRIEFLQAALEGEGGV